MENKQYLYHMVPKEVKGEFLHPLNVLKREDLDLYLKEAKKYEGREHIMEKPIPTLDGSTWNDVIHFSAIHPEELKKALASAGMDETKVKEMEGMEFYQVDPSLLDPGQTTIYLSTYDTEKNMLIDQSFVDYDSTKIADYSVISDSTKEYYKKQFAEGKTPLRFLGIPHMLHKGSLKIADLPIITIEKTNPA